MFNQKNYEAAKTAYKNEFSKIWPEEKYKWLAVKHFQKYWDEDAEDFIEMFKKATEKTSNLLASSFYFPKKMVEKFAGYDLKTVKEMFKNLFDESKQLEARVEKFISDSDILLEKYGKDSENNHYQNTNSISTYLWLRYPDKYYIFKYSVQKDSAKKLDSEYRPKRGGSARALIEGYRFYDEIREELIQDKELTKLFNSYLTKDCYPDNNLITLTGDFAYFVAQNFELWKPLGYSPDISEEQWLELLKDKTIFYPKSLEIMKRLKDNNGMGTCTELSNKYGESINFYNAGSSSLAQRVAKKLDKDRVSFGESKYKWWPILYEGRNAGDDSEGVFIWKIRKELSKALDNINLKE